MGVDPCVHIVDDDETVRKSLAYAVGSAGYATRIYESGERLLGGVARLAPGCIVTDVRMPGMDGVELVSRLKAEGAPHPILVMSGHADVALAVEAMKAGAVDFLEKPFRPSALVGAIAAAMAKADRSAPPEAAAYRRLVETLSPRQREVLSGIVEGKLNKTIAHELGLSVRTVEGYRAEIMSKTQARNLTELIRMMVLAKL